MTVDFCQIVLLNELQKFLRQAELKSDFLIVPLLPPFVMRTVMVEDNLHFAPEYKEVIHDIVFNQKKLPQFGVKIKKVSYEDGCKVYFEDDSFVICRFSGTEPLLRIFAESSNRSTAANYIKDFKEFLKI